MFLIQHKFVMFSGCLQTATAIMSTPPHLKTFGFTQRLTQQTKHAHALRTVAYKEKPYKVGGRNK